MEVIIGVIVSLVAEVIRRKAKSDEYLTLGFVVLLSLAAGAIYVFIKDTPVLPVVLSILTYAGAFYAYIMRRFLK